jgi:hypothetical protein
MLHALLHHKLDESISEPQRLEDALTSTVFGTLVIANAWNTISQWLNIPHKGRLNSGECWFWPRMAFAQPDVVLRFGDFLCVVEAKYRSGRNDLNPDSGEGEDGRDQLVRQYRSAVARLDKRTRYEESLECALEECRLQQIFLVDGRRLRHARREYEESKKLLPPNARIEMVTWQRLYHILSGDDFSQARWVLDLRAYLELCGLDAFDGIGRHMTATEGFRRIADWRASANWLGTWHHVISQEQQVATLRYWRSDEHLGHGRWFGTGEQAGVDHRMEALVRSWRATGSAGNIQKGDRS